MEPNKLVSNVGESISVNKPSVKYLNEVRKWANFLAIMGYIGVGFLILAGIIMAIVFSFLPEAQNTMPFDMRLLSIIYFVMAVIYFFPSYYLYQFSLNMKYALIRKTDDLLEKAFSFLKSHYKFLGIMTIVLLALYPAVILTFIIIGIKNY